MASLGHNVLIPAWITYIHHKVWHEITYPFPNFNGEAIEVLEWISNFISHVTGHMTEYEKYWCQKFLKQHMSISLYTEKGLGTQLQEYLLTEIRPKNMIQCLIKCPSRLGGLLGQFPSHSFRIIKNTAYLLNITFIFDSCHHSWNVVAPVEYERDQKDFRGKLASK